MKKLLIQKIRNINRLRTKILDKHFYAYVKYKAKKRKGECKKDKCEINCCGDCKHLSGGLCTCYSNRDKVKTCHPKFPIDKMDIKISLGKNYKKCGYYW